MSARTRRRLERGGVMTIVGVLLATGVLLGMGALSLDVGRLLVEKRQLQNAADAAALSLAQSCIGDNCYAGADNLGSLTDKNSTDGVNGIQSECARNLPSDTASDLPACPAPTGALADCAALPDFVDPGASYVEVRTRTQSETSSGARTNSMTNYLAGLLGVPTSSAGACARAAWGPIDIYSASLPLAISVCEWERYAGTEDVKNGLPSALPPPPDGAYPGYNATGANGQPMWPPAYSGWPNTVGHEQYILTHSDDSADCSFKGKDTAGGFGWLDNTNCSANVQVNASQNVWAQIQTGNSVPQDCKTILHQYWGKTLLVPIFDCMVSSNGLPVGGIADQATCSPSSAGGNNTYYHVLGLATLYLSGNKLSPSTGDPSLINGVLPCSTASPDPGGTNPWTGNAGRCISGWFVNQDLLTPTGSIGPPSGGTNLGTLKVLPAG